MLTSCSRWVEEHLWESLIMLIRYKRRERERGTLPSLWRPRSARTEMKTMVKQTTATTQVGVYSKERPDSPPPAMMIDWLVWKMTDSIYIDFLILFIYLEKSIIHRCWMEKKKMREGILEFQTKSVGAEQVKNNVLPNLPLFMCMPLLPH